MSNEHSSDGDEEAPTGEEKLEQGGELRTIAFRMREIQRLLGARVAQENRRLEAEGIDPVTEGEFFRFRKESGDAGEE